jgi:hypothetical protein
MNRESSHRPVAGIAASVPDSGNATISPACGLRPAIGHDHLACNSAGGAVRTTLRDRSRVAGNRAHDIAAKLRMWSAQGRDEAKAIVRRITGAQAGKAAADAEKVLVDALRALRRAVNNLTQLLDTTRTRAFRTTVKWRTWCERRINTHKQGYGGTARGSNGPKEPGPGPDRGTCGGPGPPGQDRRPDRKPEKSKINNSAGPRRLPTEASAADRRLFQEQVSTHCAGWSGPHTSICVVHRSLETYSDAGDRQ